MTLRCSHSHTRESHPNCFARRAFVYGDTQIPFQDDRFLDLIFSFARNVLKPDTLVHVGDLMEAKSFGSYENKNQIENYIDCVETNYEIANEHLDRLTAINPKAKKELLEGNHDYRIYKHIQKHPKLKKMLDIEKNLHLKDRGFRFWLWRQPRESTSELRKGLLAPLQLGKLRLYHGLRFNQYHAQYNIAENSHSVLYGDVHDFQVASGRRHDRQDRHVAYSIGHSCDESKMDWRHGKASNWIHGFAIVEWFEDTGVFTVHPIPVTNYQFIWNGVLHKG